MKIKVLAAVVALGFFGFVGVFIWAAMRPLVEIPTASAGSAPTASISKMMSEGRLDVQVYAMGSRDVRMEVQFLPDAAASVDASPEVNFSMVGGHMDGLTPPLDAIKAGEWQINLKLPMAGQWIASVGFGEEFEEIQFEAP